MLCARPAGPIAGGIGVISDLVISRGDLVYVKRWPCCGSLLGTFHVVERIEAENRLGGRCGDCHEFHEPQGHIAVFDSGRAAPIAWLRKIPPMNAMERICELVAAMA